jgi:DNA-binding winged helix-turn-helix (wHTH) protein
MNCVVLLVFDHYSFDEANRELWRGTEPVKIDPQQLDLLAMFLRHPGQMLSRQQIVDSIWQGRAIADSVLTVAIAKLRKALGKTRERREFIESRYGRGYRFLLEVEQRDAPKRKAEPPATVSAAPTRFTLVGRDEALLRLTRAAEEAEAGRGRVCLITGEPGIGKTRLAEALEQHVQERGNTLVLWARCQAETSTPLWPLRQLVRELAKQSLAPDAPEPERVAVATSFEAASSTLFGTLKYEAADHGTLDALALGLIEASRRRPLLIVMDDIQWADSASLRVLNFISDEIVRAPLLLVCTLRNAAPLASLPREVSRLWNHRNVQRIELQRLRAHEVAQYVRAHFADDDHDRSELARALFERSEGNPFFMVDLLRAYSSSATLEPSGWALLAMRERLQGLPERTRQVLYAAAVIGQHFDIGMLSHVTGSRPEDVLDVLSGSLVSHIVMSVPASVGSFTFDHALIREVLYEELQLPERAQLHLRTAEGLLQRRSYGGDVSVAELAHHFLAAQPFGDIEQAIAHAQAAATEASRAAAHSDVRALLQRALDVQHFLVAARPEVRAALLLQLAMVERIQGDPVYSAHLASAIAIAREHRLGRLLTMAGQLLSLGPDLVAHAEAASVLDAASEALPAHDYEHLAIVRAHQAWTPPNNSSARRVAELLAEAQALAAKSGAVPAQAAVNDALLYFSAGPETLHEAESIAERIELECELQLEIASQARRILVGRFRLITAMQRGDKSAVSRAIEVRAALLSRLKNAEITWHYERMLLVQAMNQGAFAQVKSDLVALRERAQRLELHASQMLWSLDFGVFLCRTSDVSALAAQVRPTLKPSQLDSPHTRASKIRGMVSFGLHADAASAVAKFTLAEVEDLPRDRDYLAVLCHLAVGAAAVHSDAHCELLLRLLRPYADLYAASVSFHCEGSVASHLGLLCEALGQLDRAREHYAYGLEREQAFGLKPRAALTGMRLAQLLLREPADAPDGLRLLKHVRDEAERMGMQALAAAARELAARSTASKRTPGPSSAERSGRA